MKWAAAKFVPRLLTEEQESNHVNVFHDLQKELKYETQFLTKVVTCDESWCCGYDPESEQQSSQWKSSDLPRPKEAQDVRSSVKMLQISLFQVDRTVHREFVPP